MVNFEVSAPGKINLFGENVTYDDHTGVMASIDRRTTAKFNELPASNTEIKLEYSKIKLKFSINLEKFRNFYNRCTFDDNLFAQIYEFMFPKYLWKDESERMIGQSLIYLLAYVIYKENINIEDVTPFQVYFETQLSSINSGGLASIVVCFTTCLLHWSNLRRGDHSELNDDDRAKISMYSKSCDKILTHCMFKSDVTVSTYGSMLRYCKDSSRNDVLDNMPRMRVLMIDSIVKVEKDMIIMKKSLKDCFPHIANPILDSIRVISNTAFSILKEIHDMNREADTYEEDVLAQEKTLYPLIRMQQELNHIFIIFNYPMVSICKIAENYELAGKCSDLIYGRNAYIWRTSDIDTSSMENEIRSLGLDVQPINLNCDGVRID